MKLISKSIGTLFLVVAIPFILIISIHAIVGLFYNYQLAVMTYNLEKELLTKGLPSKTKVIRQYNAIEGPFSSNYCIMFSGVLLDTKLSKNEFFRYYSTEEIAWLNKYSITLSDGVGLESIPLSCSSCVPRGIKIMFNELDSSLKNNYAIMFKWENYYSDFDLRCH